MGVSYRSHVKLCTVALIFGKPEQHSSLTTTLNQCYLSFYRAVKMKTVLINQF